MSGLTLAQLAAGVVGKPKCVNVPGFGVEVHFRQLTVAQLENLDAVGEAAAVTHDDESKAAMARTAATFREILCDEGGALLTPNQAQLMAENSSASFFSAVMSVFTESMNVSVEDVRGN